MMILMMTFILVDMATEAANSSSWRDIGMFFLVLIQAIFGLLARRLINQLDTTTASGEANEKKIMSVEGNSKLADAKLSGQLNVIQSEMASMEKNNQLQLNNIGHNVDEIKLGLKNYIEQDKTDKVWLREKLDQLVIKK